MLKQCELLAPAKDLESAIAAVNCGADAVYIGAPKFSARALAGNNLPDIESIIRYARPYHAKTYVALNTLLKDDELDEAFRYIRTFHEMGVDGVIIQDMGLLELDLPPIPLIASTQCHNDSWEKVKFLQDTGFKRAILARELTLNDIKTIREKTEIELETFIHGALCVSYSGQCYLSFACGGRSGNRGVCAQPCRQTYTLKDNEGKTIVKNKHLLSLKDLNQTEHLKELLQAGVTSFKIEGRLKDINYIRNVVSFYRKALDKVLEGSGFTKSSSGHTSIPFEPDPNKTFNRGYTTYFINGRKDGIASMNTQKSTGEPIGKVKKVFSDYFIMDGPNPFHNGDGICFFDKNDVLGGMFINRVDGDRVYPNDIGYIFEGTFLYRNQDHDFEKQLKSAKIERRIPVVAKLFETPDGFLLNLTDEEGFKAEAAIVIAKTPAEKPEMALENIRKQLSKMGDSVFTASDIEIRTQTPYFIPVRELNELRRSAVQKLTDERVKNRPAADQPFTKNDTPYPVNALTFEGNVLNKKAEAFYFRHGVTSIEPAAESGLDMTDKRLMTTRHCLKYEFGLCLKYNKNAVTAFQEPFHMEDGKNRFRLEFDCRNCRMELFREEKPE